MKELNKQRTTFNLFKKDRIYKDKTLSTLYFRSNKNQDKKSRPIDINGIRYKLDLESGEISNYTKKEVLNSMSKSIKRTKILLNMLLEMNDFDWFATLTFDKEKIDRTNDAEVFNAYVKYINNIKHKFLSLRYICVPERHEDNCIHFHLLIGGVSANQLGLVNSGKVFCHWAYFKNKICSKDYFEKTKNEHELTETDGLSVYNITTFPYGLTTASRIASRERCNSYVKKYIDKALGTSTEIFKKRFYYSDNLEVPTIVDRLIGSDFSSPKNLNFMFSDDPHLQNAKYVNFNKDYNVLQFWEDNNLKECIDNGLIPLSEKEIEELGDVFNG